MTKEMRSEAINRAYEAMLALHDAAEAETSPKLRAYDELLYDLNFAVYQILLEGRKEK